MDKIREGWNFHNDIAISLESHARRIMKYTDRPYETIFDADAIESESFFEVMIILLWHKNEYISNDKISNFIKKGKEYIGVSGHKIPNETANKLFEEFKELIK